MTENTIRWREILLQDRDLLAILDITWASSLEMYWSLFSKSSPCNLNILFQIRDKKPLRFFFPLPEGLVPPFSFFSPSSTTLSFVIPCQKKNTIQIRSNNSGSNRLNELIDDVFAESDQRRRNLNWRDTYLLHLMMLITLLVGIWLPCIAIGENLRRAWRRRWLQSIGTERKRILGGYSIIQLTYRLFEFPVCKNWEPSEVRFLNW